MMKLILSLLCGISAGFGALTSTTVHSTESTIEQEIANLTSEEAGASLLNNEIDMEAFLLNATEAARHRESRRLSEEDFIAMSQEPDVVVLDARSRTAFEMLHVKGAVNLPFPDFAEVTLGNAIPKKDQKILLYCNNNFRNAGTAMVSKLPPASLNLSTYSALYNYGYQNVYELEEYLDIQTTDIPIAGLGKENELILDADPGIFVTRYESPPIDLSVSE